MPNKTAEEVVPEWMLYLRDETEYWNDPKLVERCGGKVVGVYYFDCRRYVHCAEITPSYELLFLESVPFKYPDEPYSGSGGLDGDEESKLYRAARDLHEREREAIQEELRQGDVETTDVSYFHVRSLRSCVDQPLSNSWDGQTLPCCVRLQNEPDEKLWQEILNDHDGDSEKAHDAYEEHIREWIGQNGFY